MLDVVHEHGYISNKVLFNSCQGFQNVHDGVSCVELHQRNVD